MKAHLNWTHSVLLALSLIALESKAGERSRLTIGESNSNLQLSWPAITAKPDGSLDRPFFEVQRSTDLRNWHPFAERMRAPVNTADQTLSVTPPGSGPLGFFRLLRAELPAVAK